MKARPVPLTHLIPLATLALCIAAIATIGGTVPATAAPDTVAVAPPAPIIESPQPNLPSAGRDGAWWPVPMPATGAEVEWPGVSGLVAPDLGILADIGGRHAHTVIFDPVRQRFIAFGGTTHTGGQIHNDLWERALTSTGDWIPLAANGAAPAPRYAHTAVYDPTADRMIVYAGRAASQFGDVWELALGGTPTWNLLAPTGAPPAGRSGHSAALDVARNRMVVFGGRTPSLNNETWFLNLGSSPPTWQLVAPSGSPPSPRQEHVAIFDTAHDRMVMYGGLGTLYYQDVWTLSMGSSPAWTQRLAASGAGRRDAASAVFDAVGNRMVVFGGSESSIAYDQELWALDLTSFIWTQLNLGGIPPAARRLAALAIDPTSRLAILQGGIRGTLPSFDDTWSLTLGSAPGWTQLRPPPPPPPPPPPIVTNPGAYRYGAAGVFDAVRRRYLVTGGAVDLSLTSGLLLNDVHELVLGRDSTWIGVSVGGTPFSARYGHSAVLDPIRDRIIVFGGYDGSYLNDLWEIRLSPSITCAPLAAIGPPPGPRDLHTAIYDPVRDRMVVFGGNLGGSYKNDTWALALSGTPTWSPLTPSRPPPPVRLSHTAVYDPYSDRMLVFGGFGSGSLNDLWSLSLGGSPAWAPLSAAGTFPGPRHSHSMSLDPNRQRAVIHGGRRDETTLRYAETWELLLTGSLEWRLLPASGGPPPSRYGHLALIDPFDDRLLLSGGYGAPGTLADVWRLQWASDQPTAATMSLISSDAHVDRVELRWGVTAASGAACRLERKETIGTWRTLDTSILDGSGAVAFVDREVVASLRYGYRLVVNESGEESLSPEVWLEIPSGAGFALHGFSPNPAGSRARVEFSLPDSRPATIELVDVSGRRLAQRRIESPAAGATTMELAPEGGLAPGLYFIRLTQGERTMVRRGSVMR